MAGTLRSLLLSTLSLTLPLKAYAHMEMVWPIPFNSKYDAAYYGSLVDYSMTSPLLADGSNYPCKNYQTEGKDKVQAEYVAGQQYNITLAGTATHGGGSCQISLSYDNGKTFHVVQSYIGGCPLTPDWDFTIPEFAPSADNALLAWTWFNLIGNREMYMNCARVSVSGGSSTRRLGRRGTKKRQSSSFDSLPENFACNIDNGCQTIEEHEVVFPNPGDNVAYGKDSYPLDPGPGFTITGPTPTGDAFSTVAPVSGGASAPTAVVTTAASVTSAITTTAAPSVAAGTTTTVGSVTGGVFATMTATLTKTATGIFPVANATSSPTFIGTGFTSLNTNTPSSTTLLTVISSSASATSQSPASATPSLQSGSCTPGQFSCNTSSTWSQCVPSTSGSGTYIYMGAVPAGMECSNGSIVRDDSSTCTPVGVLLCEGESTYQSCVLGGTMELGAIAPGSTCQGGVVFPAPSSS